jgi:hypothetical protein
VNPNDIANRFTYHAPKGSAQVEDYSEIRTRAKVFAEYLNSHCPESREKSLAITHLEEAVFWANASIAREDGAR